MFKKLLHFIKNLFKPSIKKYEGKDKPNYNTKPQDKTWKDKQEEKLKKLDERLNDDKSKPTKK